MSKMYFLSIVVIALVLGAVAYQAPAALNQGDLERIVKALDGAVVSIRKGELATTQITEASKTYDNKFSGLAAVDNELHATITNDFISVATSTTENSILALKANVLTGAGKLGMSLSSLHSYAILYVFIISLAISLGVTLVLKKTVNWKLVNESKVRLKALQDEYNDARRKKDMKKLNKLNQNQQEIKRLSGIVMSQTMKPTFYYMIPLLLLWMLVLGPIYGGWVVALLPFRVDLPIFGTLVAFGVGWWYLITMMGFSSILKSILIPEANPTSPVPHISPPIIKT